MNLDELITRYNRDKDDFQTQLALANHLHCPIEILEQLVSSNYLQVSEVAKLHVKLAGEITAGWQEAAETAIYNADLGQNDEIVAELLEFAPVPDFLVGEWMPWKKIQTAVENPYLSVQWRDRLLTRLAEHWAIDGRIYAAGCEHTPVSCLEMLAGDISVEIRTLVSFHPNSVETWFETIQQQRDLATSWHTPPQQLASLAASKWVWIRLAVAENPYTPGDILLKFAKESSFLLAIAKNPLAPTEALDIIAQKSDTYINKALAEHPNASESILLQLPTDCNQIIVERADFPNLPHSILTKLASDRKIRYLILNNPNAPSFILDKLAHCDRQAIDVELRQKNLTFPIELSFQDHIYYLTTVAKHPHVLVSTLEKLAEYCDDNPYIGLAIIQNDKTPKLLRDKLFNKLANCSDQRIQQELAKENNNQQLEQFIGNVFIAQNILRDGEIKRCLELTNNNDEIEKCLEKFLTESHLRTCLEIAKNLTTEGYILERLANYPNFWQIEIRSTHPNSRSTSALNPPAFSRNFNKLLKLLHDLRCAVASHPNTPSDTLASFAYDSGDVVLELLAKNPYTPVDILSYLANNPLYLIRIAVAENPSTPLNISLINNRKILQALAKNNPNLPNRVIQILIDRSDFNISSVFAENKSIDVSILEELAKHHQTHVRLNAAKNSNTSSSLLAQLANDSSALVRREVAKNPNTSLETLTKLSRDSDWVTLWEISKHFNISDRLEQQVLTKIAKDRSAATSEYRLELAKNTDTNSYIIEKLIDCPEINIRYTLAKREDLKWYLSEQLISLLGKAED